MSTLAEVRLWGKTIGAVSLQDGEEVASFEYDAAFAQSGIQIAPMVMPLSRRVYRFPDFSRATRPARRLAARQIWQRAD